MRTSESEYNEYFENEIGKNRIGGTDTNKSVLLIPPPEGAVEALKEEFKVFLKIKFNPFKKTSFKNIYYYQNNQWSPLYPDSTGTLKSNKVTEYINKSTANKKEFGEGYLCVINNAARL